MCGYKALEWSARTYWNPTDDDPNLKFIMLKTLVIGEWNETKLSGRWRALYIRTMPTLASPLHSKLDLREKWKQRPKKHLKKRVHSLYNHHKIFNKSNIPGGAWPVIPRVWRLGISREDRALPCDQGPPFIPPMVFPDPPGPPPPPW